MNRGPYPESLTAVNPKECATCITFTVIACMTAGKGVGTFTTEDEATAFADGRRVYAPGEAPWADWTRIIRLLIGAYIVLALFWLGMGWEPLHLD